MTKISSVSDKLQSGNIIISGYLHKLSYFEINWNVRYVQFDGNYIRYFNESNGKLKGEIEVLNAVAFENQNGSYGTVIFGFKVIGCNKEKMSFGVLDESLRNKWLFNLNMKFGSQLPMNDFTHRNNDSLELCVCTTNQKCNCNIVSRNKEISNKRSSVFTSKTKRSIISLKSIHSVDSGPSPAVTFHVGTKSKNIHYSDRSFRSPTSFWSKPRQISVEVPISDIIKFKF